MAWLSKRGSLYYIKYWHVASNSSRRISTGTSTYQIAKEKLRQFEGALARGEDSSLPTRTTIPDSLTAYVAHIRAVKTVKNLARSRPGTMDFARELKNLHDEGWSYENIAAIACRSVEYIRQYIRLVENGEERLIQGVEQDVFPISFAVLVAQADDASIQNVLMDAFDQGIVNSANFAKARAIINARMDSRKTKKGAKEYTVAALTEDIATATHAKDSYVREAQGKESRLFTLLDGLAALWKDVSFMKLIEAEHLEKRPELAGTYNVVAAQ